ncbi:MAG: GTPase HflX [Eubacteriales bacterium]
MVSGNTVGVKNTILNRLDELMLLKQDKHMFVDVEILKEVSLISDGLKREISLLIARNGKIEDISIGDSGTVSFKKLHKRRAAEGLSGYRLVHTHPNGSPYLSKVDIGTLIDSRLDAMAAVSVFNGQPKAMTVGYISDNPEREVVYGPFLVSRLPHRALLDEILAADERVKLSTSLKTVDEDEETAILVGLNASESSMEELEKLAVTAGAKVLDRFVQNRERDKKYYIGSGMARELSLKCIELFCDTVIVNDTLSPAEANNLEEVLGDVKVIDRTALILDIFAKHAVSSEGKLQVELAQLKYYSSRLAGQGKNLSRLGGGIGTRGPGEKKLEVDKRVIRDRMHRLNEELFDLKKRRELTRQHRRDVGIKNVVIVGYTNAGKSTILNYMTNANVGSADKLFETLDTTTRRLTLPSKREILLTDTVGFIQNLPHELISAFSSTLSEVTSADLILHVMDVSDELILEKRKVVDDLLVSLGAGDKDVLYVYNKIDLFKPEITEKNSVLISAKTGEGICELMQKIEQIFLGKLTRAQILIPYNRGDVLSFIAKNAAKKDETYEEGGTLVNVTAESSVIMEARRMLLGGEVNG